MDFRDSPQEVEFRNEVRGWLETNLPEGWIEGKVQLPTRPKERYEFMRGWQRTLAEGGWLGMSWPPEYGGRQATPVQQVIFLEEFTRTKAPEPVGVIGLNMAGPTIFTHGTDQQKQRFLSKILSGEEIWCQGFSEPNAGSDLASLQTKAVRDGDDYIVNGQKVWSSYAEIADWCLLVVRTDPDAAKHAGLTYLLVDMKSPGVEVRPIRQASGDAEFNEIFFTDVRVPVENRLEQEGDGWGVAMTTLMHERGTLGLALQVRSRLMLNDIADLARRIDANGGKAIDRDDVKQALAQFDIEVEALKLTGYRSLSEFAKSGTPGPEGSVLKLHWSELNQRMSGFTWDILGPISQIDSPSEQAVDRGRWQYGHLRSLGNTIEAGTSEILRNIIAERVLGLPKSR